MSQPLTLITGGSRGLGRSAALHLAQAGHDIVITCHTNRDAADSVVAAVEKQGRKAAAMKLDCGESSSFDGFVSELRATLAGHFGRDTITALVNNAGHGVYAPFDQTTEEQFDGLVNVHLKATFFLTQKLLPLLADGGDILNLSSGLSRFSLPGYAAYGAVKAAIDGLTRYMAAELGPRKIRVNSIAPGAIETDFGGGAVRDNADLNAMLASQTALGRVGLPDDIGSAIALLLSPGARWVNGQRIEAAGGIHL